jgi:hypothetical protein
VPGCSTDAGHAYVIDERMEELGRLERYDKELSKITKSVVQFNPKLSVVSNWSDRSESAIKVPAVVTWL